MTETSLTNDELMWQRKTQAYRAEQTLFDEDTAKSIKYFSTVTEKFRQIEEKNRCVRVQFLDWLSTKLSIWSAKLKETSDNIHSPCMIKIGDTSVQGKLKK